MTMRLPLLTLFACVLVCLAAAPALARSHYAPCLPGKAGSPTCHAWNAKVVFVDDGDTVDVKLNGRGRVYRIRMTGYNATELHRYSADASKRRGECHGVAAADTLERMIRRSHWRVRLVALHPS